MKVRIVVGIIGLDQHEVGAIAIARLLTLHGFEVIYLGRFQTPQSMIAAAVDEGAQVVGASCHSWEFISFAPELAALAKQEGVAVVLGGSVITPGDAVRLRRAGIDAVFGPLVTERQIIDEITRLVA
ncbi:MAG TPA: cobalamin-dependent protein [Acidimicrobiia bacterium]|nr:cobalamin-dependent protein [Acidimicrobiia bacterium]